MAKIDKYNFSGGQNSQASPLFMKDSECELIQNYHLDNVGSLTKRNGIANLVGQIVDGVSILGMYFFKDIQGTDYGNVLVACNDAASPTNSDIYKIASNAWAKSKQDDTSSSLPVFTSFLDYVFRTNGTQVMGSSADLSTWGTTSCLANSLLPKYCWVWEDRVYAANGNDGTNYYPSRIWWSSLGTYGSALTWDAGASGQWADINPDDNDEITWGEPFGRMTLIFKNKALYRWTFGQTEPDRIVNIGTPQGRTVKQLHGIVFFLGNNNNKFGVYSYVGSGQPQNISKKIKPFIDAIPVANLTNCRAEVDDDHYYLYIGDVTVKSVAYANVMLVYTVSLNAWHIETYQFEIKSMARFETKTLGSTAIADAIYLGDDDGFVYRKDTGASDYLGTTAKTINGKIITKEYPLIDFPKTSILDNLYILSQKASGAKVNFRINRGDWQAWKDLTERITEGKISGRAKTIQFEFTDNSLTTSQIEGISVEVKGEKTMRRIAKDD